MSECYHIPDSHKNMLLEMLKDTQEALKKASIPYFIDGGTLLGAVRHKGIIPWDDDIDIGVMKTDWPLLRNALIPLVSLGYYLEIAPEIMKVFLPNQWILSETKTVGTPTLDIFPWEYCEGKFQLSSETQRKKWPECFHTEQDFFPFKEYDFGTLRVRGVWNPRPYLSRMYPDYEKTVVIELRKPPTEFLVNNKAETISLKYEPEVYSTL